MAGRPTDYEDTYPELLLEHFKKGYSFESFGGVVGVCKKTLYNWLDTYPEFLHAKERGTLASLYVWEGKGIDGLYNESFKDDDGMTVSRSINATIYRLNMNCRFKEFGWGEKSAVEISGPEGKPIETKAVTELPDDQLDAKIQALMAKLNPDGSNEP